MIGVCREASDALAAIGARVEAGVDVTDGVALKALALRLGDARIEVLVRNAGILSKETLGEINEDGFERMRPLFEVDASGPLRTVQALSGQLAKGAKVGIVTSRMGSVADNGSGGFYTYRASEAAVNAIGKSLALDLKDRGIAVMLLQLGYVATEMVGGGGDISPDEADAQLVDRLDSLTLAQTGMFQHAQGDALPW